MNVIPMINTIPERIICLFNWNIQYIKNDPFNIKNIGKIRVRTDKNGKNVGAKNGKTQARNVNTVSTILKKNITLLNQDSFFIFFFKMLRC